MVNIVSTDFNRQGIDALNMGMGIGNQMQRTKQLGIQNDRQAQQDAQSQQLFGQKSQLNDQSIQMNQNTLDQQDKSKGMAEILTAVGISDRDLRIEFLETVKNNKDNPTIKKVISDIQGMDDQEQIEALMRIVNAQQKGGKEAKDTRTSGIKEFEYYNELKKTNPDEALAFGKANGIVSEVGNVIMKTGDVNTINKGVSKLTGEYKAVRAAAKDLERLGKLNSAPAQMAMIFKFMKALDPASTVRESEYASAANTTGIPERIMNMYNKAKDGQMLNDVQVNEFINVSKTLANVKGENVRATVADYLNTYDITDDRKARFMKTARVNPFKITSARATQEKTLNSSALGRDVTEQDIFDTLQANPALTREQLLKQLGVN